jgi:signal peptidase I
MFMQRLGAFFLDIIEVVVFAIAIFLFIYLLVMQPHRIKGSSMEPNFHDGEYLLSDKITYRLREPQRGDVIVFEAPGASGDEFIKRIIGLPGDKVSVKDGRVYLNAEMLNEIYIPTTTVTGGGSFLREGSEVTVPDNFFFVLGDNRSFSSDSRAWGFVSKTKITGRAWFIYWPPEKFGTVHAAQY